MKKIGIIFIVMIMMIMPVFSEIASFEGGIVKEMTLTEGTYNYQEVLFITGEPIVLTGTVVVPSIPEDQDTYTVEYTYELRNVEKNVEVSRKVSYNVVKDIKETYKQTIYDYEIAKLDESIDVDGVVYTLDSKNFTRSMNYDNTAAVDYFSGNLYLKRTYYINGDQYTNEGKVVIETTSQNDEGALIGYKHLWGSAETYMAKVVVEKTWDNPDYDAEDANSEKTLSWQGFIDLRASEQIFSDFKFQKTSPLNISFLGNYVRVDQVENIFQYTYDLPEFESGTLVPLKRNKGEDNIRTDKVVNGNSMVVPKIQDIGGHWAEESIFLLSSLEVINNDSEYYGPNLNLTRIEFAEMISNAIATIADRTQTDIIRNLRPGSTQMFLDIPNDHPKYNYVVFVYNNDIMEGYANYFDPDLPIRRSEMVKIMIDALGLENRAPQLPFETRYDDDAKIPNWAKRYVYMADEIGLVTGYPDNTFKPDAYVSRAEAARMIHNFIYHIKDNIRIDFREKLINRY